MLVESGINTIVLENTTVFRLVPAVERFAVKYDKNRASLAFQASRSSPRTVLYDSFLLLKGLLRVLLGPIRFGMHFDGPRCNLLYIASA